MICLWLCDVMWCGVSRLAPARPDPTRPDPTRPDPCRAVPCRAVSCRVMSHTWTLWSDSELYSAAKVWRPALFTGAILISFMYICDINGWKIYNSNFGSSYNLDSKSPREFYAELLGFYLNSFPSNARSRMLLRGDCFDNNSLKIQSVLVT